MKWARNSTHKKAWSTEEKSYFSPYDGGYKINQELKVQKWENIVLVEAEPKYVCASACNFPRLYSTIFHKGVNGKT